VKQRGDKGAKKKGTLVIIGGHEDHDGDRVILKEVASRVADGRLAGC
jgi:cyanophycinase